MTPTSKEINYIDKIDYVLDNFNFEKVHAYMLLTKWQWWKETDYLQPTIQDLKDTAQNILWSVTQDGKSLIGQGGFYAYRFEYGIKLSFEPFRSSSF